MATETAFILGVSGSGKSFVAKREIVNLILSTDDDVIIADPQNEYAPLIRGLGGTVIEGRNRPSTISTRWT